MARLRHFYGEDHLDYLATNIYRRARIFDSNRYKRKFIQTLGDLRAELGFKIVSYVLMPEYCHLLIVHNNSGRRALATQPGDWL
jgi:REP element-mobilizing transposase RayT